MHSLQLILLFAIIFQLEVILLDIQFNALQKMEKNYILPFEKVQTTPSDIFQ